jgi:hypothetical protein
VAPPAPHPQIWGPTTEIPKDPNGWLFGNLCYKGDPPHKFLKTRAQFINLILKNRVQYLICLPQLCGYILGTMQYHDNQT